jgi:hypothetical protein
MASRLETAAERLQERMLSRASVTVTLKRGSLSTSSVSAVVGNQLLKVTDSDGNPQTIRTDKDFMIARTAYLIGGTAVEPQKGDRIVETIDSAEATYEVLPYGDEKEWRWSDEYRKTYRIHTRRVK